MKEIEIKIWEIDRDEIAKLPDKSKVLIYHTIFRDYNMINADRLVLKLSKLSKFHKFFCLDEPDFNNCSKKSQNKKA